MGAGFAVVVLVSDLLLLSDVLLALGLVGAGLLTAGLLTGGLLAPVRLKAPPRTGAKHDKRS